jgi:multiple sugar transport system permease protein
MENYALNNIKKIIPAKTLLEFKNKNIKLENYPKELLLNGFSSDVVNKVSFIISDAKTQVHILEKPPEVSNVNFRSIANKDTVVIGFYKINPINFYFDKTSMEVNYNFIEVVQNVFQNYVDAWNSAPFGIYFMNSVLVAGTSTIVEVIFAILAAFAFAKLEFAGKEFLFALLLMTMMIPGEVLLVPNYISLTKLGWIDTYYALITPWLVSVFTIFLMRQFFMSIPQELFEAAKIDGCSPTRFLWQILVPLSKPVIVTAALLKFVGSWNSFLWVLIVTKSPNMRTLPVGLQNFQSEAGTDFNLLMAASAISIIPVLIIFFFAQKQFIRGIAKTGIK